MTKFIKIDGSCYVDQNKGAWAVVTDEKASSGTLCTSQPIITEKIALYMALNECLPGRRTIIQTDCLGVVKAWDNPDMSNPFDCEIASLKKDYPFVRVVKVPRFEVNPAHLLAKMTAKQM